MQISGVDLDDDLQLPPFHKRSLGDGHVETESGAHLRDGPVLPPLVETNAELTDLEESKLKRDRVIVVQQGVLQVTIRFPSLLLNRAHAVPGRFVQPESLIAGGERGVTVRLHVRVVSAEHLPQVLIS